VSETPVTIMCDCCGKTFQFPNRGNTYDFGCCGKRGKTDLCDECALRIFTGLKASLQAKQIWKRKP
jgi:hypothetical protein